MFIPRQNIAWIFSLVNIGVVYINSDNSDLSIIMYESLGSDQSCLKNKNRIFHYI